MALNEKPRNRWWSRLHFVVRFAGLTGLLAVGVGVALALLDPGLSWGTLREAVRVALEGQGDPERRLALYLSLGGAGAALLALLVEVLVAIRFIAGRHGAFGFNALIQGALALLLLVGVNVYSFQNHVLLDWTRDRQFTLPQDIQQRLGELKAKTTIVVYQRHKTFGQPSDTPDAYEHAAEGKVVEKVKDVVDELRVFGPQFEVAVLDAHDEDYHDKLAALTQNAEELRREIEAAPENSIFFYARDSEGHGRVQRLSFSEFDQLDKTASRAANGGRGDLVLLPQGAEAFARKVLNLQERRPRVGICVNFEVLTTEGPDLYGLRGLRHALESHGFDVRDIVLRQALSPDRVQPAAYTYEESRFNNLQARLAALEQIVQEIDKEVAELDQAAAGVRGGSDQALARALALEDPRRQRVANAVEQLTRLYADRIKGLPAGTRDRVQTQVLEQLDDDLVSLKRSREHFQDLRDRRTRERDTLDAETFAERQHQTDLKAKLTGLLEDCDLVIVPRMTIVSLSPRLPIPNEVHRWDPRQVEALREFIKSGKPVLACFGPTNPDPLRDPSPPSADTDEVEGLLGDLGLVFGKETVLFDVEAEALSALQSDNNLEVTGVPEHVPPVDFAHGAATEPPTLPSNPIRADMQKVARSLGKDLDLEIRYPRPLSYEAPRGLGKGGAAALGVHKGEVRTTQAAAGTEDPQATAQDAARQGPEVQRLVEAALLTLGRSASGSDGPAALAPLLTLPKGDQGALKEAGWQTAEVRRLLQVGTLSVAAPLDERGALGSLAALLLLPEDARGLPRGGSEQPAVQPEFMMTSPDAWEEDQPFPVPGRVLWSSAGKRGPFSIGVAVEAEVPPDWYGEDAPPARRKVRVAAIGQGGWFVGSELSPAKEKLLLSTCNWLVGRDAQLTRSDQQWSYPRVDLDARSRERWRWGLMLGLPALFFYLGLTVLLARRLW